MIKNIYKITLSNEDIFYTSSREDLITIVNDYYSTNDNWKPYTIHSINNILYSKYKNKKSRGVISIERFNADVFYEKYITAYLQTLEGRNKKYHEESVRRLKNQFVSYIDAVILKAKNNNENEAEIDMKINNIGLIAV